MNQNYNGDGSSSLSLRRGDLVEVLESTASNQNGNNQDDSTK